MRYAPAGRLVFFCMKMDYACSVCCDKSVMNEDLRVIHRHLFVTGRVQGVGYRWAACQEARRLGVGGWVRNRADGRVELLVSGAEAAVLALVAWSHRGPPGALVERVDVALGEACDAPFAQRPTE